MCSHFESPSRERLMSAFGNAPDGCEQFDIWPTYVAPYLVKDECNKTKEKEENAFTVKLGRFGLLPHWATDEKFGRNTFNCRSETASSKPSFRSAWNKGQHCVIPTTAIYEPDWRTGKPVATRISRSDGGLLMVAGLWEQWVSEEGKNISSFTMLTINASDHPMFKNFHRRDAEKRMVVILSSGKVGAWLDAEPSEAMSFMKQYSDDRLVASASSDGKD